MSELIKKILDQQEQEIRSRELEERQKQLEEKKIFDEYVEVFEREFHKMNTPTSKLQFVKGSLERAVESLESSDKNYRKMQSPQILYRINAIGKYIEYLQDKEGNLQEDTEVKTTKEKFTHKQQILLLKQLGFFELDFFSHLNETQKGVLVSYIVNRDEKNSEDNIRYVRGKKTNEETKKIFSKVNVKKVNDLLQKVGLTKYEVK